MKCLLSCFRGGRKYRELEVEKSIPKIDIGTYFFKRQFGFGKLQPGKIRVNRRDFMLLNKIIFEIRCQRIEKAISYIFNPIHRKVQYQMRYG